MENEFTRIIMTRLVHHFDENAKTSLAPIQFSDKSMLDDLLTDTKSTDLEFFVFLLSLLPHTQPHFLSNAIQEHMPQGGDFPEIGGVRVENFRGIFPTLETAIFFIQPQNGQERIAVFNLFEQDHYFYNQNILHLDSTNTGIPYMANKLSLSEEVLHKLLFDKPFVPKFSTQFPAQKITTSQTWDDLVLSPDCRQGIEEIENWVTHNERLSTDSKLEPKIKLGYRALFFGPPGTGKTLTATLLGNQFHKDVFRVDLSTVVSKYIGETEKNLSRLLDMAEGQGWILMFDEADSLFGKRTKVNDANDRYANQNTSFLLQRIENYNGLVILTSNLKSNIDKAFMRRFQTIVHFKNPDRYERQSIWNKMLPDSIPIDKRVDMEKIAANYELTGGNIINVIQKASLLALRRNEKQPVIKLEDIMYGIRQEFSKEERIFDK